MPLKTDNAQTFLSVFIIVVQSGLVSTISNRAQRLVYLELCQTFIIELFTNIHWGVIITQKGGM